ncbi:alpha/beta hydrolase family protein [Pinibacter aurantiacus]|uniref:Proline iminopeptidase n=1 Tax=Pinibacter aurantiacus TaxID=2851599 RepID=A0A9E2S480_9BACT|nr:alpha/beta fold hydrolase [Pinibacter aurantiacus]MBV4356228.1 alpha/beta hydrolase [Pinibacter aurantiacus]
MLIMFVFYTTMSIRTYCLSIIVICIQSVFGFSVNAQQSATHSIAAAENIPQDHICEEKFLLINGIEQWLTIKGNLSKPVILFLHGGPGSVMSPYADHIYKQLENDFIVVQWDQRGAGRTFGKNAPGELTKEFLQANVLTIDQMAADGIALTEQLCKQLKKKKVILFGTSWGSALGVTIATKRPDLFYAYVGHSQIVNPDSDDLLYNKVQQLAQKNNDTASLNKLNAIGKPPYERARTVGKLWKIVKKYERENSIPAPQSWFIEDSVYANRKDEKDREDGDDYSFVNFVGDKQLGVSSMRASINFLKNNTSFQLPVYLIQGEEDILTPKESTRAYFDKLKAPKKEYFLLPKTAHGFNQSVVDTQYKIFKSILVF